MQPFSQYCTRTKFCQCFHEPLNLHLQRKVPFAIALGINSLKYQVFIECSNTFIYFFDTRIAAVVKQVCACIRTNFSTNFIILAVPHSRYTAEIQVTVPFAFEPATDKWNEDSSGQPSR